MSLSIDPIRPYFTLIKYGAIAAIILAAYLFLQHLYGTISDLELQLSKTQLEYSQYQAQAQSRENSLQDVITVQKDSISRANQLYTSLNSSLGTIIQQNKKYIAERTKVFDNKQVELQNANIPSNCADAVKFMANYNTNNWNKP